MNEQFLIFAILFLTLGMFLWGRWRHDMVAMGALLACVLGGLVEPAEAFSGFGHPAVITVACVLVLSRGLQTSGAVDVLTRFVLPAQAGPMLSLAALVGLGAFLSGFMNNVGAMALLMPVAVQLADRLDLPPGRVLMPLAFGTILGGMTTMIGTPPNLIVSGFRAQQGRGGFGMFDFTPVGLAVALVGLLFIITVGWRLVPVRKRQGTLEFETGAYMTEALVPPKSNAAGMRLREIEAALEEVDVQIIGLIRNEVRINAPPPWRQVLGGDILVIEAEADALAQVLSSLGLKLAEAKPPSADAIPGNETSEVTLQEENETEDQKKQEEEEEQEEKEKPSDEVALMELVVRPEGAIVGRSATDISLRSRYGINMLAISREGSRSRFRLRTIKIRPGDLLLMQGPGEAISEFATDNGCVPLAERELRIPDKGQALLAGGIMAGAVGGAALGLLPAAISFAIGVLASMAFRTVSPLSVYKAIDWSVVVLLAALLPVATAAETSGTAALIARFLMEYIAQGHSIVALTLILIISMFLSDLINNAATAAVMCPIALGTAAALDLNADAFLMAVAIGSSCAFLTPIGHQNNTLILGPGGFKFSDYWRIGLPLEILVLAVSIPVLLYVWPL
ncbi:SLC13 family permease [Desulfocastanea catecholica]